MYIVVFSVIIGSVIGAFTNALAIKMLFRPFKPWYIGKWQIPFTPGVIPKRKGEIADKLGNMVENYLFTSEGLGQFLARTGFRDQLFSRIEQKWKNYLRQYNVVGELFTSIFTDEWKDKLKGLSKQQIHKILSSPSLREKRLDEIFSEEMLLSIEERVNTISRSFVEDLRDYLHSQNGHVWLQSIVDQLLGGKKMLGFLSAFIDSEQILQKLVQYLEQVLVRPETEQVFTDFLLKEWNDFKEKPIGSVLNELDNVINEDKSNLFDMGITYLQDISIEKIILPIEENKWDKKLFDSGFSYLESRLDKLFSYLSISEVVKEEVNRFSFEELEKMIIEIADRELKMITYFGGVLGGFLGLIQGIIYFSI